MCTVMTEARSRGVQGIFGKLTKRINFKGAKFWCVARHLPEGQSAIGESLFGAIGDRPFAVQGRSLRVSKALMLLIRLLLLAEPALLNRKEKSEANEGLPAIVAY